MVYKNVLYYITYITTMLLTYLAPSVNILPISFWLIKCNWRLILVNAKKLELIEVL